MSLVYVDSSPLGDIEDESEIVVPKIISEEEIFTMPYRSFRIKPDPLKALPPAFRVESSADGLGPWTLTDVILAAELIALGEGYYRLDAVNAPPDQYVRVLPTDGVLVGSPFRTYPPHPTDTATFTVEVDTVDGGMGIVAGLEFSSTPKAVFAGVGIKTATGQAITTTAADGKASLTLPADAGIFVLRLGRGSVEIDTAGRGATTVNFADLLP
jgi:hypothetical protein